LARVKGAETCARDGEAVVGLGLDNNDSGSMSTSSARVGHGSLARCWREEEEESEARASERETRVEGGECDGVLG
jgi:hypothetical protein